MDIKKQIREFYEKNESEVNKAFASNNLEEINEVVRIAVTKAIEEYDYTEYFYQTKRLELGDVAIIDIPEPRADVYMLSPGASLIKSNISEVTSIQIPAVPITASYDYNKLQQKVSPLPKLEDMVDTLLKQIQAEIQKYALSLAVGATTGPYLKTTTLSNLESTLESVVNSVFDVVESDANVYIIGRRKALSAVSKLENASQTWLETREKKGYVAYFLGAELKEIKRVGVKREPLVEENEIFVVSPECGKFVYYGSVQKGTHNPDMWTEQVGLLQFIGGAVIPELGRIYRIKISDL